MFLKKHHFKKKFVDITLLSPLIFINNLTLFSIYKLPSKCFIGWNKLCWHHIWWNVLQLLSNQPKFLIQFQHLFGRGGVIEKLSFPNSCDLPLYDLSSKLNSPLLKSTMNTTSNEAIPVGFIRHLHFCCCCLPSLERNNIQCYMFILSTNIFVFFL